VTIRLFLSSIDGSGKTIRCSSLAKARAKAQAIMGRNPDMGSYYAVSYDGICKLEVEGCHLSELFGDEPLAYDRLVEAYTDGPYSPVELVPANECEEVVVDCDSDEYGVHYHYGLVRKVYGPFHPRHFDNDIVF
jgi:hypothetical protein